MQILGILLASRPPFGICFQHCHRIQRSTPPVCTPVDVQVASVLVAELEEMCEMRITLLKRARVVGRVKSPELLAVVETDKAWIVTEKLSVDSIFIVLVCVLDIHTLVRRIHDIVI